MLVTVIIPTADRHEMLREALDSVAAQSLTPHRVIVIDNGRNSVSPASLSPGVELVRTAPRIGAGAARNVGLAQVTTEFTAFLDDDDWWSADFLQSTTSVIVQSSFAAVASSLSRATHDGLVDSHWKCLPTSSRAQRSVYWRNPGFTGSNVLYRTDALRAIRGFSEDSDLSPSEDRDLLARLLMSRMAVGRVNPPVTTYLRDHRVSPRLSHHVRRARLRFIRIHGRQMRLSEFLRASRKVVSGR